MREGSHFCWDHTTVGLLRAALVYGSYLDVIINSGLSQLYEHPGCFHHLGKLSLGIE